ncbi:Glycogen synthase [Pseudoclavibacter triregionum]|nr:Glycogen synthase [Pseudoclavibacter triregionum]
MKIGLLAHAHLPIAEPYGGGLEAHTGQVAAALAARGHEVILAAKAGSQVEGVAIEEILRADFAWRAPRLLGDQAEAQQLEVEAATRRGLRRLREAGCEVILNNSLSAVPYAEAADLPMLTLLHTPATLERVTAVIERPGWSPPPWHRWASVSTVTARAWRELLAPAEVPVVPNGIELDEWAPRLDEREGAPRLATWTGRITPEKGLPLAIDAARLAGLRLEIIGPISDPTHFEADIAPRLGPDITWLGHLRHAELAERVREADVHLVSSIWPEPFGLVALEAMACGTPVAVTPIGALPDVAGREGGVAADSISVADLAEAALAAARLDRRRVRARAERFGLGRAVEGYLALLGSALAESPRRAEPSAETADDAERARSGHGPRDGAHAGRGQGDRFGAAPAARGTGLRA